MRISDWSSDVCSSDLAPAAGGKDRRHSTILTPGQRLNFDAGGLWTIARADTDTARGWTRGELIFRQRTLHELLDEANRYSTAQIHVGDASLYDLRGSGVFDHSDRSAEPRGRKECDCTGRYGWSLVHKGQ